MKKFKEGMYYVDTIKPSFISVIGGEDFTEMIGDFSAFTDLGVDFDGDYVQLINMPDNKGFIIVPNPVTDGRFIRLNEILKNKEEEEMSEVENSKGLTLEERIKQLEQEKAELQIQIKNQEKYDEIRKIGDELALYMKALQDSGFSRDEAMQIFMITSMNAVIPPFLRR